jgi:lipopolysaccharide transport system ATP-binding protein
MSQIVISVENLSKAYRLGQIGTGTLTNDLKVWWAKKLGKPNPMLRIGDTDHGNRDGETLWALKDVSFQVEQGEVLGIIGRNGAGKSTLLKILSRVTAPTSGCVKVKGRIASLLEVGTGFHPDLTGRENIYLNGAILGMSKEEVRRKFDEIVSFAEIEKFVDTPVKRYSSGMYVRLAFAVAAHLESEILLVDEVLAVGDAEFQKKCLGKMGDVASKEGRTVLFVSHNMGAIQALCLHANLLKNGRLISHGNTSKIIAEYQTFDDNVNHEYCWPNIEKAPGNDFTRLYSVIIHTGNGKGGLLYTSDEISISIQFWNLKDNLLAWAGANIYDTAGGLLFSCFNLPSTSLGEDPWRGKELPRGLFESTITFPKDFFNDKTYSLIPYLQHSLQFIDAMPNESITFHVNESGEMRREYTAPWQGALRPKGDWKTRLVATVVPKR